MDYNITTEHEDRFKDDEEKVMRWSRSALKEASNLAGKVLNRRDRSYVNKG
ncbi:hypothetical protein Pyn_20879 [Prunus yedoensis var. nudiflora]|uniref:TMV resistance protein N-like n=1 Tax=Prunus yedoensis var. nudiflora TaxID=2094558 RepID=A0A314XYJ6_PRUYE|nr:hypothetical protein Pyn_20879 [Prunus yedoensis var. nudiflora]